ncbi:hypothetical protein GCM10011316_38340 [Roseibium aquae]|uniref:Uncharacterized protein n=1 Tax=Roseibium aquae TaxID=1323746 RepID=A0A916TQY3_9HYPH|nr:hypothetical protein [Roseibium aquae]GGB62790.1 hypothetical protein GCM10011316_38340 [Roseibium aquae]
MQVEHDHLRKLANATPVQAYATRVDVDVDVDVGDLGIRSITVTDNGTASHAKRLKRCSGRSEGHGNGMARDPKARALCAARSEKAGSERLERASR